MIWSSDGVFKYVDDTTTHEIVKQGEGSQAQTLLDKINDWSKANKFHLNPQKCKELRIKRIAYGQKKNPGDTFLASSLLR